MSKPKGAPFVLTYELSLRRWVTISGMSSERSRSVGTWIGKTFSRNSKSSRNLFCLTNSSKFLCVAHTTLTSNCISARPPTSLKTIHMSVQTMPLLALTRVGLKRSPHMSGPAILENSEIFWSEQKFFLLVKTSIENKLPRLYLGLIKMHFLTMLKKTKMFGAYLTSWVARSAAMKLTSVHHQQQRISQGCLTAPTVLMLGDFSEMWRSF